MEFVTTKVVDKEETISENNCSTFNPDISNSKQNKNQRKSLKQSPDSQNVDTPQEYSEAITQETPKILVQRVFFQTEKHTVEKKLDFVIANSETEITKHVFGGLFNTKYYPYIPENYCKKHAPDLFEYENEELPKIGDKFDSHDSFRLYIDGKAKEWKYYLKCADSHRKNGRDTFVYKCVFAKPRSAVSKAKGLRKRTRRVPLHDCPCRVLLKPVPSGAKDLTVIYVCNHHDHPLTDEYFLELQHGRRLHPSVKEELMDLLALDVDKEIVKKYVESLTGFAMSYGYFANIVLYMKKKKIERQFSVEKLKEMSKKIEKIKEELGITNEYEDEDNPDDDFSQTQASSKDMHTKIAEVFNVLNVVTAPKKTPPKRYHQLGEEVALDEEPNSAKYRKQVEDVSEVPGINKSRLETRLQELKYDEETLENIKHLQDAVRTENNPWVDDHNDNSKSKRATAPGKEKLQKCQDENTMTDLYSVTEIKVDSVVETPGNEIDISECDNEVFCEYEVTTGGNNKENDMENTAYDIEYNETYRNNDSIYSLNLENGSEVTYCVQYENIDSNTSESDGSYIVLNNLENVPLQVQATEFATVRITPEYHEDNNGKSVVDNLADSHADTKDCKIENTIESAEQPSVDDSLGLKEGDIYEIIETNNKKILPNREVVRTVILNKPNPSNTERHNNKKKNERRSTSCFTDEQRDVKYKAVKKRSFHEHVLGQMSHYGVDLNQMKDDDYYVLLVDR